jgi:sugar-specific transcriptional regulator TrmB
MMPEAAFEDVQQVVCMYAKQLIDELRNSMYMAVRLDEFAKEVSRRVKAEAKRAYGVPVEVSVRDVAACLAQDSTVKIYVTAKSGVVWLWSDWMLNRFINDVVNAVEKYKEAAIIYRAEGL